MAEGGACAADEEIGESGGQGEEGGAVVTAVILYSTHGGGGRLVGWHHVVGEDRERGGSHPTGRRRPTGSGLRLAGASSVARPCHAVG
jgi:hypothetical protein